MDRERVSDDRLRDVLAEHLAAGAQPHHFTVVVTAELLEARDRIARALAILRGDDREERGGAGASPYDVLLGDVLRAVAILEQP